MSLYQLTIPKTGSKRYITAVYRNDKGGIVDAAYNIYSPINVNATISELNKAFPLWNITEVNKSEY